MRPTLWLVSSLLAQIQNAQAGLPRKAFDDPRLGGGSMLAYQVTGLESPAIMGEPLNVIISGASDERVLAPTSSNGGIYNYFEALGYGGQCMGLAIGGKQAADLGDGQGPQMQWNVLRYQYYRDIYLGTCLESIYGGAHFRVYRQATTGAYFLELKWAEPIRASSEQDMWHGHAIALDGYDRNRNEIVGNATGHRVSIEDIDESVVLVTNTSVVSRGWEYNTTVTWTNKLLRETRTMINHFTGVQLLGKGVTDGYTAILTVTVRRKA